jgi:predicted RNA-binding Zn-ribbon protein involved in translation (DUF1610 family)
MKKPTTCHFFCVQIEIDHLPARGECPDCGQRLSVRKRLTLLEKRQ